MSAVGSRAGGAAFDFGGKLCFGQCLCDFGGKIPSVAVFPCRENFDFRILTEGSTKPVY